MTTQPIKFVSRDHVDVAALIESDRVHGSLYTDDSIYEMELTKIFYEGWVFVGHDSEIPAVGQYVRRTLGREEVLLVRQRDDSVAVLMNRCSHRGNMICTAAEGKEKYFTCTYHGWVFDLAGQLKDVPYPGGCHKDKSELGLKSVRSENYRGFVFATFNESAPPLAEHLGAARKLIDRSCDMSPTGRIKLTAGWVKQRFDANWKMLPENETDGYHVGVVHSSVAEVIRSQLDDGVLASEENLTSTSKVWGQGHTELYFSPTYKEYLEWFNTNASRFPGYIAQIKAAYGEEKGDAILRDGPPHAVIFPNLFLGEMNIVMFQATSAHECVQWTTPMLLEEVDSEINHRIIRHSEAAMGPSSFILADDSVISERQQMALRDRADWLDISRGLKREYVDEQGLQTSHITDETTNRSFWQHYKHIMTKSSAIR